MSMLVDLIKMNMEPFLFTGFHCIPFFPAAVQTAVKYTDYGSASEFLGTRASQDSLIEYLECLKADTVRTFSPLPVSCFKSPTIKKRIIMLTNHKSKHRKKLRYLGIRSAVALMIVLFHTPADRGIAIPFIPAITDGANCL